MGKKNKLSLFLAGCLAFSGCSQPLTSENLSISVSSLDKQVLAEVGREDTILNKILEIDQEAFRLGLIDGFSMKRHEQFLEDIFLDVNARDNTDNPVEVADSIHSSLILNGVKKNYIGDQKIVSRALTEKRIDCDTGSFIIMHLLKRFGIDSKMVTLPGHVFLRIQTEKGEINYDFGRVNKEGKHVIDDSFYIKEHKLTERQVKNGVYLRSLNLEETLAIEYFSIAGYLAEKKKFKQSEIYLDKVLSLNPRYLAAYINRASILNIQNKYESSLKACNKALEIDPDNIFALVVRGVVLTNIKEYKEAEESLVKSREINEHNYIAFYHLGNLYGQWKKYEQAAKNYELAIVKCHNIREKIDIGDKLIDVKEKLLAEKKKQLKNK